jgi:hypothetical protein
MSKKWSVSLDRPGSGWSTIIEAETEASAIAQATLQYREKPDTIYEISEKTILDRKLGELDEIHTYQIKELLEKQQSTMSKLLETQAKARRKFILANVLL